MKNKKSILAVLSILVIISTFAIGSLANWFTSSDSVTNNFKLANYEVVTHEKFVPKNPKKGSDITKEVTVKNTGTLPTYVRVKIVPYWKNGMPLKYNGINTVDLNFTNSKEWVKNGDFYYYKKILQPGETSEVLLNGLTVSSKLNNNDDYKMNELEVDVFTESVIYKGDMQKENNKYTVDSNKDGKIELGEEKHNFIHNEAFNNENLEHVKEYFGLDKSYMDNTKELNNEAKGGKTNGN